MLVINFGNICHRHWFISFTCSKLNVDEICGLKSYLLQKLFLKSTHAQRRSLLFTWIYNFVEKSSILWSKKYYLKKPFRMEGFQKYSRPLFTFIFKFRYIFHFEHVNEVWIRHISYCWHFYAKMFVFLGCFFCKLPHGFRASMLN